MQYNQVREDRFTARDYYTPDTTCTLIFFNTNEAALTKTKLLKLYQFNCTEFETQFENNQDRFKHNRILLVLQQF